MAVWSSGGSGWSNGSNLAVDNNPGTTQTNSPTGNPQITYVWAFGSPIKAGTKIQFEILINSGGAVHSPWWFLQTANGVGVDSGSATLNCSKSYNQAVLLNGVHLSSAISDPEGDGNNNFGAGWPGSPIAASPSWWIDGTRVTILVDRIANQMTFITHGATGASIGGHTYGTSGTSGPFNISSWGQTTVYPWVLGWWLGGGRFTLLGGGPGQALSFPQAGYTNLDGGAAPPPPPPPPPTPPPTPPPPPPPPPPQITSIAITEAPNPVVTLKPFGITATANLAWPNAADVYVSTQLSTAGNSFIPVVQQSATAAVSISGTVANISGLLVGSTVPHNIIVQSFAAGVNSNTVVLQVTNTAPTAITVLINSPAIRVSPFVWAGDTGRGGSLSRTSAAVGAFIDFYINASATPVQQINVATAGAAVLYDYLIGGNLVGSAVSGAGGVNITGLTPSATNWVRLYLGSDGGTLSPVTVTGMTIDSGSSAGTAPAALQAMLFAGDGICQPAGLETTQGFVYLMAKSLGLGTWDIVNSSYNGNGWMTTSEGPDPYDSPGVTSRWNLVYPTGISNLDSNGVISALGGASTPPRAMLFYLGSADCIAAVSLALFQAGIVAAMAQHRAALSPATALIILVPFGLYDTVAYPTGLNYVTAITNAAIAANQAGTNVGVADPGSVFGISMRTGGYLLGDNQTPTAAGHVRLAATYLPLILPLLTTQNQIPATVAITVPAPLVAGVQPIVGNFSNGVNPSNLWLAWSPSPFILTTAAFVKLATITGSSFSASMNLTAPVVPIAQIGGATQTPVVSTMYYSVNANQAVTTIDNSALGVITLPTIPDQLQAAPVTLQIGFNYQPVQANIQMSNVADTTPIFAPLVTASAALPVGAVITVPVVPTQKGGQAFSVQVGFNYVPNRANLFYSPANGLFPETTIDSGLFSPFSTSPPNAPAGNITWDSTGQLATLTFSLNSLTTWSFQIVDRSGVGVKSVARSFTTTSAPGGGGTIVVATPSPPLAVAGNASVVWDGSGQLATITLANAVLGAFNLQIEDTTYTQPVMSTVIAYNVTGVASAAAATLTVPVPTAPILLTSQTNGSWTLAPGNWTIPVIATTETLTLNWSNGTKLTRVLAAGLTIVSQTLQLYTIVVFTPAQPKPNVPFAINGEFVAGTPTALDLSFDGGATWSPQPPAQVSITALPPLTLAGLTLTGIATSPATSIPVTQFTGAFQINLPAGLPAAPYAAGMLMVRDHNVQSVFGAAGFWSVSTFDVTELSAPLVFGFDPAVPSCIGFDSAGNVQQINDIRGNGMHASIGPTAIPTPATFTPTVPLTVAAGADVLDAAPVGPKAKYVRLSGLDSTRTLVGLSPTIIADNQWDPAANFFSFGQLGGPNDAMINLFATINMEVGVQTIVEAVLVDITVHGGISAGYGIGLIWGAWDTTQTVSYLTPGRWHASNFAAQFFDSVSGMSLSNGTQITNSTWAVVTLQRNGTLFEWRINKGPWTTATINNTGAFNPTNCYWGGSVSNSLNQPGGNAFPYMGAHYTFGGGLTATELANVETLVGVSIGKPI